MPGLKLKWDVSGGKTIHEVHLFLLDYVVSKCYSHYEATGYLLRPYFLKMMRIPYKVYLLMYVTKLSCTCRKRIKGRKEKKQNKTKK